MSHKVKPTLKWWRISFHLLNDRNIKECVDVFSNHNQLSGYKLFTPIHIQNTDTFPPFPS